VRFASGWYGIANLKKKASFLNESFYKQDNLTYDTPLNTEVNDAPHQSCRISTANSVFVVSL
jgi:hypothetical protein